jgi:hypothetical protein
VPYGDPVPSVFLVKTLLKGTVSLALEVHANKTHALEKKKKYTIQPVRGAQQEDRMAARKNWKQRPEIKGKAGVSCPHVRVVMLLCKSQSSLERSQDIATPICSQHYHLHSASSKFPSLERWVKKVGMLFICSMTFELACAK